MPGMYAVTSIWFVRRTRAIFRRAEFGFFGVIVRTIVQTPRFWGAPRRSSTRRPFFEFQVVRSAGVSTFLPCGLRPLRTSCEIVGTFTPLLVTRTRTQCAVEYLACCLGSLPDRRARPAWARSPGAARPQSQDRDKADARNDRPEGRSPSRKTGRTKSLGGQYAAGQQREPPFAARSRALRGRWVMVRPLVVVAATVFLAACTPLRGSPGASPKPQAPPPLVSAGPAAGPLATAA